MRQFKLKPHWVPQHRFRAHDLHESVQITPEADLRPQMPPVYDQGDLGSCSAQAMCTLASHWLAKHSTPLDPSRLFLYYAERLIEDQTQTDSGATMDDGAKVLGTIGTCQESLWPYDATKFAEKPPRSCFADAAWHVVPTRHLRQADLKGALASGLPVAVGIMIYASFEAAAASGRVPMPVEGEACLGGHAVLIVGYAKGSFIVRNSWGPDWGDGGYCYVQEEYLNKHHASDYYVAA